MYRKAPSHLINIAATIRNTQFLGPGNRCVVWVRGCLANCRGCVAPDWQSPMPENFKTVFSLYQELVENNPDITGITISGGEPFLQAEALANFLDLIKSKRDLDVLIYSGYLFEDLMNEKVNGAKHLLSFCDVLIDGRYVEELNQNQGLFGSSNQKVHYLTGKISDFDFDHQQRKVEFRIDQFSALLVGVPPRELTKTFLEAVRQSRLNIGDEEECSLQEETIERQ